jgi:NAD(P)H-flavin reductase/hemoglobin-like flavoprotein
MDPGRLRENFAAVAQHGDQVALFFFSDLFLRYPQTREMFPVSMAAQRARFLRALGRIVADVDRVGQLTSFLQQLGRDHRKFGTIPEHFGPVGESLLATLAHFTGPDWSPELAAEWTAAYQLVAQVMIDAASEDAQHRPPFWDATVISHDLRTFDICVLRVAPQEPLAYRPGQSVGIESSLRPRIWRYYSIANAPREDSTLDFHVQMVDGGTVSTTLVRGVAVGSRLRLGAPIGTFTLRRAPRRDVLLAGYGTGIAPLKAITEEIAQLSEPPRTHMFVGARDADALYELAELEKIAASAPWLTVTGCASDDPGYRGERGTLADVVSRSGTWSGHDAYLAGPAPVTEAMSARLASLGVPQDQISVEDFGVNVS